ncbi:MAG: MFS transporter [Gammaproteobacteria bacterium]|nr:MFS transporter [Gammaproteobacteria bacterium]
MSPVYGRKTVIGWALYDWANSAFSLTVVTVFFPILLSGYWNDDAASVVTTFRLGWTNAGASLIVALFAPVLGVMADGRGSRKRMVALFAAVGISMTAALFWVAQGEWLFAIVLYALAYAGFAGGNSFYDSLLTNVADDTELDRVSAYGFALGYLGGALLFTLNVLMVMNPDWFGLATAEEAMRWSFLSVGIWWGVFSIPLLLWVPERAPDSAPLRGVSFLASWRQVVATLRNVRHHRALAMFLLAYWLYIDGVYTIIKMAVDYGLSRGLAADDLISAILLTNYVGFPAAIAFGVLGARIGARKGIYIALTVYVLVTLAAPFVTLSWHFYALAFTIGLVQGGVQSLSRSLYARLVPYGRHAEFFGFYNMLGKFAAILGPALTGVVALLTGSQRLGILSVLVLFLGGLYLLRKVPIED